MKDTEAVTLDEILYKLAPCKGPSKCRFALDGTCQCGATNKRTEAKAAITKLFEQEIAEARIDEVNHIPGNFYQVWYPEDKPFGQGNGVHVYPNERLAELEALRSQVKVDKEK